MKKIANSIHHTHWDLIWYFTTQDATVQLSYNFKELLKGFKDNKINNFYFDGQTAPLDEYLSLHPEDKEYIKELVSSGKLVIGPFNSQLDSFISSGESVINNLKLGFKTAESLGKVSKIAYLPDSFGHSIDFPKIFNKFGIKDFVIKRGVGDEYGVDSEFNWKSKDGSQLLVFTMIAGYGYGCYAFKEKTLFTKDAVDYNKISVDDLINRITKYSSLDNDFVFLLGFDQNPAILNIDELIEYHNKNQDKFEFVETTWEKYFEKIRDSGVKLKEHNHELFATQYHRVHRSIFSARADIKAKQDEVERILTYQVQPYMTLLDDLGVPYDSSLVYKAWETLVLCQTHSSANLTDETNEYIMIETNNALNLANSMVSYLNKLLSISMEELGEKETPLLVVNTLPITRNLTVETLVFTKNRKFSILDENKRPISYTILNTTTKNNGVLRKDVQNLDLSKFYYVSKIVCYLEDLQPLSYNTLKVVDGLETSKISTSSKLEHFIENEHYMIYQDDLGVTIKNKETGSLIQQAIYIEDGGDEGDSFDYSYPDYDMILRDYLYDAKVTYSDEDKRQTMVLNGTMNIPYDLKSRRNKNLNSSLTYKIKLTLNKGNKTISISGDVVNEAIDHRVRLIFTGSKEDQKYSFAGTQFGYIERETKPEVLKYWKEEGWFEEPSPTYPLLNHVSSLGSEAVLNVFTRSSKEYEFINENTSDIAVTLFRSYGALGYPDLNRRPGRPGGLDYMIFETKDTQMKGSNKFDLGFSYSREFDGNKIRNEYIEFATDLIVHHQQDFDKSINAIQYFPTNEWYTKLPFKHSLLSLDGFRGSFGSIVKEYDDYILRVYNNEDYSLEFKHSLNCDKWDLVDTDLVGNDKEGLKNNLSRNELKIVKIKKRK